MGSSGLIYAAIVSAWAAVLVPRWVRRNEEIDQAREADLARGVRVLDPPPAGARGARLQARHEPPPIVAAEPPAPVTDVMDRRGTAARRRRRVLIVLVLALIGVTAAAVAGALPLWSVGVSALVLAGFLRLARRAAAAEARRRAGAGRRRTESDAAVHPALDRIAVLDEPKAGEAADPHAWEPVPVPLPTYLTKPKAPQPATRTIDLSQPGAWTSGRLDQAGPPPPPWPVLAPQLADDDVEDLPESRRAVGD